MYWFGEKLNQPEDWKLAESWGQISALKKELALTSVDDIITTLDSFGKLWSKDSKNYSEAIPKLIEESGFSSEEVHSTLSILPQLLSRESLEARVKAEFTNVNVLDTFSKLPHFQGMVKAVPKGVVLHVTAGNVFLSSIDSLIMGFLTKNISIVKVSSSNQFFPFIFC